ncbi:MAG: hypothetical protein ACT4TC_13470, partial [Myxococcaceae bacterium]
MKLKLKRILSRTTFVAAVLAATAVWAAVEGEPGIGLPRDASWDGHEIDSLMNWTHLFNVLLFAIVCGWMGWAVFRHNEKHTAEYDHGDSKRSVIITLGIASLILFGIYGHLFVATFFWMENIFWNFSNPLLDTFVVLIVVFA